MRFGLIAAAAVAAITVGSGAASAQIIIPQNGPYYVAPARPIVPLFYTPGFGFNYGVYSPPIIKYPSIQPSYFGSIQPNYFGVPTYLGRPVVVPPTTYLVPQRSLYVAPYTPPLRVIRW